MRLFRVRSPHLYLGFVLLLGLTACGSSRPCPPCHPELQPVEVPHPYPVVLIIEMLPPLELEPVPAMVPRDADPEVRKANALAIAETRDRNRARLVARDEAWALKISHHNELAAEVERNNPN